MRSVKSKAPASPARPRIKTGMAPAANDHAEELMALAVDAAQSRHLPDFLKHFAERSAHMMQAAWGGVTVILGRETELYTRATRDERVAIEQRRLLLASAREDRSD